MASRTRAALLFGMLVAAGGNAVADQRDPRLDPLFETLRVGADSTDVADVEGAIWQIWLESGDLELDRLMAEGVAQMAGQDLEEAVGTFSEIIRRAPEFAEAWNKRATAHYLNQDFPASVADISRTLELEPRHFGAIAGMGLILIHRRDALGALRAFERVLQIHPRSPAARHHAERLRALVRERAA